jgi:hypothetical protein
MDTNPTLCVCCYMMIAWVQDPLYPSFYSPSEVGFTCKIESVQLYETQTISLLALFARFGYVSIISNPRVRNGPPDLGLWAEWANS